MFDGGKNWSSVASGSKQSAVEFIDCSLIATAVSTLRACSALVWHICVTSSLLCAPHQLVESCLITRVWKHSKIDRYSQWVALFLRVSGFLVYDTSYNLCTSQLENLSCAKADLACCLYDSTASRNCTVKCIVRVSEFLSLEYCFIHWSLM